MKILYSYNDVFSNTIPVEVLRIGILSATYSNLIFGNSTFIGSRLLIDKFKKLKLPFTDYIVSDNVSDISLVHKLKAFCISNEPFIHLDLDLILTQDLVHRKDSTTYFAHRDIDTNWDLANEYVHTYYLRPASELAGQLGREFFKNISLDNIPNTGIVYCNNPDILKSAIRETLELYSNNRSYFDRHWIRLVFLEQALMHRFLIEKDTTYHTNSRNNRHLLFEDKIFLHVDSKRGNSTKFHFGTGSTYSDFAFDGTSYIDLNLSNFPALHFIGNNKYFYATQILVIHNLLKYYDIHLLEELDREFSPGHDLVLSSYKDNVIHNTETILTA